MDSIWIQYGLNMDSIWIQHGFNMDSIWIQYGFNMDSIWIQYEFKIGFKAGSQRGRVQGAIANSETLGKNPFLLTDSFLGNENVKSMLHQKLIYIYTYN